MLPAITKRTPAAKRMVLLKSLSSDIAWSGQMGENPYGRRVQDEGEWRGEEAGGLPPTAML